MKEYKDYKICITGPGGAGKTTLMKDWANEVGAPIKRVKTTSLYPEGVKTHKELLDLEKNDPRAVIEFQKRLASVRYEMFKSIEGGFITDRSSIDTLAYFNLHNSFNATEEDSKWYEDITYDSFDFVDVVVIAIPNMTGRVIEDNGVRNANLNYYNVIRNMIKLETTKLIENISVKDFTGNTLFKPSDTTSVRLYSTKNLSVINLLESETGMFSREERVEAIKKSIDLIKILNGE